MAEADLDEYGIDYLPAAGGNALVVQTDENTNDIVPNLYAVTNQITISQRGTYLLLLTQRIRTSNQAGGPNYKAFIDLDGVQVWPKGAGAGPISSDDSIWVSVNAAPSFTDLYVPWSLQTVFTALAGQILTVTGCNVGGSTGTIHVGYSLLTLLKIG